MDKWDLRFLGLAKHISTWSKDPSTKTGAVIVDLDRRVKSVGYNGFAKGVNDTPERLNNRELKYKLVVHCERNAILFADSVKGCTLYTWPFCSCSVCASMVIQAGIKRCVAPPIPDSLKGRWGEDVLLTEQIFKEAGVVLDLINCEGLGL
jgi:dCMP deaminase